MTLQEYKELIETRLDLKDCLEIKENKIVPSSTITKAWIKSRHCDDLFSTHNRKIIFTNRMMHFVSEMTDRKVYAGHYSFELREATK